MTKQEDWLPKGMAPTSRAERNLANYTNNMTQLTQLKNEILHGPDMNEIISTLDRKVKKGMKDEKKYKNALESLKEVKECADSNISILKTQVKKTINTIDATVHANEMGWFKSADHEDRMNDLRYISNELFEISGQISACENQTAENVGGEVRPEFQKAAEAQLNSICLSDTSSDAGTDNMSDDEDDEDDDRDHISLR